MSGLDWLLSFSDPKRGVGWNTASRGGLEWNLRRTRLLLDLAGSPDRRMHVVLIAGTKGKGSTAAMLASLLAASRVRAGLSTKPHLQAYRERVRVDGVAIDDATLASEADALRPLVAQLPREAGSPTTFELTTVLALRYYARRECAVAILEVGLGGRFDATNATDPTVSIITRVSHDHTKELGSSLRAIATEKAGVMRPGRIAIMAPQPPEAAAAIRAAAARDAAILKPVRPVTFAVGLAGAHQRANAGAALAAAETLATHGVAYDEWSAKTALTRVRWPGRFEIADGVVLDGAHNDGSAEALAATLRREYPRRRVRFVLGLMQEKDAAAVIRPLLRIASAVEATRSRSPRALAPAALARRIRGVPVRTHDTLAAALAAARRDAAANEIVCVTGSLALVGEARDALGLPVAGRLWG